ncbi:MAG: hypothetical protein HRT44_11765 [Bdellovibrionales bacterium]|nr:hypothetical protein [Bdellovibrionales bacterium]NQZ19916.1 hypothetical protein [Bdellovibrionales bacterium]
MPGRRFVNETCVRNVEMPRGFMAHTSLPRNTRGIVGSVLNGPRLGPRPRYNEAVAPTTLLTQTDQRPRQTPQAPTRRRRPLLPSLNIRTRTPVPTLGGDSNCTGPTPQQNRQYSLSARAQ